LHVAMPLLYIHFAYASTRLIEPAARAREALQQRRGRPLLAVCALELADAREHLAEADGVGPEHRAAAPGGEAVAVDIDHVDVGGALRDPLLEDARAFVHQRKHRAIDDLGVLDPALRDAGFLRAFG